MSRTDKACTWAISIGLILFICHNPYQPFLKTIFLPSLGLILLAFGTLFALNKCTALGPKSTWIPLLIIAASIGASGVERWVEGRGEFSDAVASLGLGVILFGLFVASRSLGDRVFKLMPAAVVVESVSIVVRGATHGWGPNGGILSPTNYDIATGLVVFGVLVSPQRYQWWLGTIGAIGLLFSGSAEAMFVGAVMLITILIKQDWGWKLVIATGAVAVVLITMFVSGIIIRAQNPTIGRIEELRKVATRQPADIDEMVGYRLTHWKLTMPVKPFGYGINITNFYWGIPHNIILIIIEQIGPLAALMWLWVALRGTTKKKWQYAWIGMIALGIFDHFLFTQACVWFWVLAGVSAGANNLRTGKTRTDDKS